MASRFLKGIYVSGIGDGKKRPQFYNNLGMQAGTINIELPAETDERLLIPNRNHRIRGVDQIDIDSSQDFLVRRCQLKGVEGYQVLPIDKDSGAPRGHHARKWIEISLPRKIELKDREELEVELHEFDD